LQEIIHTSSSMRAKNFSITPRTIEDTDIVPSSTPPRNELFHGAVEFRPRHAGICNARASHHRSGVGDHSRCDCADTQLSRATSGVRVEKCRDTRDQLHVDAGGVQLRRAASQESVSLESGRGRDAADALVIVTCVGVGVSRRRECRRFSTHRMLRAHAVHMVSDRAPGLCLAVGEACAAVIGLGRRLCIETA